MRLGNRAAPATAEKIAEFHRAGRVERSACEAAGSDEEEEEEPSRTPRQAESPIRTVQISRSPG